MKKLINNFLKWLSRKIFVICYGDELLKEREEQEIRIAQFQNDIIKLRKKIKKLEEEKK